ncbi:CIC11C00000000198 [Sungouiella intermedia]|uniref:CIC11C00000000198 n=1 Tax=Sungouiella intermedia TaxID=45354 RepID=A0A1L0C2J1_9ASCO|nr:CIC11C00000000198 [[Candida] intermedia]
MANYNKLLALLKENNFDTQTLGPLLFDHVLPQHVSPENVDIAFDLIVENQRGLKLCGIPMFSRNSLIPFIDPPLFQRIDGLTVLLPLDKIENYPLPDLGWVWSWHKWYVLMLNDVDDQGWMYQLVFLQLQLKWHGAYYFGDFVRRRLWVRMRQREKDPENSSMGCNESI